MVAVESLNAISRLPGSLLFCSWEQGWRSLLLREFQEPACVEEFLPSATPDQLVVLMARGSCEIESFSEGRWRKAHYEPGHLGFTRPGSQSRLRWRGSEEQLTVHAYLPATLMCEVATEIAAYGLPRAFPNALAERDQTVATLLRSLGEAARAGVPDLYAETVAHTLAVHSMMHQGPLAGSPSSLQAALLRADERLRASLGGAVSLQDLAEASGLTRFQVLRAANAIWGETPMRRLTRLRMKHARHLLATTQLSILEIAFDCGYGSSAHFANAFRRHVGVTPSDFRRG